MPTANLLSRVLSLLPHADFLHAAAEEISKYAAVDRVSITAVNSRRYEVLAHAGAALLPVGAGFAIDTSTHFERAWAGLDFASEDFVADTQFRKPLDNLVVSSGFRSGLSLPMALGDQALGSLSLSSADYGWELSRYQRLELEATASLLASHVRGDGWREPICVLIAHDDPLVAAGIRNVLGAQPHASTTIVSHPDQLTGAVETAKPDVVVVGEDFGASSALSTALNTCPWNPPVIYLTPRDAPAARLKAGDLGASAFVPHARAGSHLAPVIATLLDKGTPSPEFQPALADAASVPRLTPREQDLLHGLDSGDSVRQIADSLGLSETTLKGYCRDLYAKLRVHSRGEAVHAARLLGLIYDR